MSNDSFSTKISIAYLNESLGAGGAERQLVELVKNLNREQFHVQVMTYIPDNFYLQDLNHLGITVHCLPRKSKTDLAPIMQLASWLRSSQVDIVHAYLATANLYAVLAKKLARKGKVLVSERSTLLHYTGLSRLKRTLSFWFADLIIANSATAQRDLVGGMLWKDKKVKFIPNGIDVVKFTPTENKMSVRNELGWPNTNRTALTIAGFKPAKNHLGMLDALEDFRPSGTPFRYYWAGQIVSQELLHRIKQRIATLGLTDVVDVLGPRDDVIALYQACDVFILNSLWEGTPNVLLEAIACGCPVIATNVSDVSRYVIPGETGWLIPPDNPGALRETLNQVSEMKDQDLKAMGLKGRQHLLRLGLDFSSMARSYEKVYKDLIGISG
ncbi:MAG: glycosyltransferase [Chloroflexota bacterium]